jgi:hypothetical protein
VVHRWFSGQRMPESWKKVQKIADDLQLSYDETSQLREAYERSTIGEEQYESYQEIIEILREFGKDHDGQCKKEYDIIKEYRIGELPEFTILENETDIIQCMENLLAYLAKQKTKHLYLKMQNELPEVSLIVKIFCQRNPDCEIEKIIYMNNELIGSNAYNMKLFHEAVTLLLMKCRVQIYYAEADDRDRKFAVNWMLSDDFFIQFNDQMSYGMITTKKEWLDFFLKDFFRVRSECSPIGQKNINVNEYFNEMGYRNSELVGLEFMPCVGECLTERMLRKFIYKEIPDREVLIQNIIRIFIKEAKKNMKDNMNTFFFYDGMIQFMETGFLEIFPYQVYHPLDMETRCEILKRAIELSKSGRIIQYMFKPNQFPSMQGIHIEQIHGETEKLIFERRSRGVLKEQIQVTEKRILHQFWQFFHALKKSDYVYSREETVAHMEQVLEKYKNKIEKPL